MLRDVFTQLLEPACDVVGAVADGRALLTLASELRPDIVVLDIGMPLLNGLDAARQLKDANPEIKLIFLTMSEDPDVAAEAFRGRVGLSPQKLRRLGTPAGDPGSVSGAIVRHAAGHAGAGG